MDGRHYERVGVSASLLCPSPVRRCELTQLRLTVVFSVDRERKAQLKEAAESRAKIAADLGDKGERKDVVQPLSPLPPQESFTRAGGGINNGVAPRRRFFQLITRGTLCQYGSGDGL